MPTLNPKQNKPEQNKPEQNKPEQNKPEQNKPEQDGLSPRLLVAGTGYGVGKTVVLEAIAQHRAACSESNWGRYALHQASGGSMDLAENWRSLQAAAQAHPGLLIEAVGSLGTPVTPETTLADLAWDWRLPTLLVTAVAPHCLDDLAAHAALARQTRCAVQGIVLNCLTREAEEHLLDWANPRRVEVLTQLPVLGQIPYLVDLGDRHSLAQAGASLDIPWGTFLPSRTRVGS